MSIWLNKVPGEQLQYAASVDSNLAYTSIPYHEYLLFSRCQMSRFEMVCWYAVDGYS